MSSILTTLPPLAAAAETWVVAVASVVIIASFVFLLFLLILSGRVKSAKIKPDTNVRRRIFYAEMEPAINKQITSTTVEEVTTDKENKPSQSIIVPMMPPQQPPMFFPLPPRPRPFRVMRPIPTAMIPAPVGYYPGRMFASRLPTRYQPLKIVL